MSTKDDKQKAIELAIKQVDKAFGKGTLIKLGEKPIENIETIPTGSIGLDMALGIGGIPQGRIVEIYGPESSGKTILTLQAIAECQKNEYLSKSTTARTRPKSFSHLYVVENK